MVIGGTKWPSITSTWIQSAPAAVTARTSSASRPKSAERIDGAIIPMRHRLASWPERIQLASGGVETDREEAVERVAMGQCAKLTRRCDERRRCRRPFHHEARMRG